MRDYNAVIKGKVPLVVEWLLTNSVDHKEKLEKREIRIVRKIYGSFEISRQMHIML